MATSAFAAKQWPSLMPQNICFQHKKFTRSSVSQFVVNNRLMTVKAKLENLVILNDFNSSIAHLGPDRPAGEHLEVGPLRQEEPDGGLEQGEGGIGEA